MSEEVATNNAENVEQPDLSPGNQDQEKEKVEFSPEQQEVFNKAVAKKTAAMYEEKQRANNLQAQLDELNRKAAEQAAPQRPEIPELPDDPLADNYEAQLKAREDAIAKAAEFDVQQRNLALAAQQQEMHARQNAHAAQNEKIAHHRKKADELGVSEQMLQESGKMLGAYGISQELTNYILAEEKGPLIQTHLAGNPAELEKVIGMDPMQAAVYINSTILPAINPAPGQENNAPIQSLNGGGPTKAERGPAGATYE